MDKARNLGEALARLEREVERFERALSRFVFELFALGIVLGLIVAWRFG